MISKNTKKTAKAIRDFDYSDLTPDGSNDENV
jgi:hypothetical protein